MMKKKKKKKINKNKEKKKEKIEFKPINYDKDSTYKPQIDFLSNFSNLRAKNYNIEQEDKFKINIIAGKMIPGIITSTAAIAGLLALQLYVICQNKNYKTFMVGNMNLADNTLALAIPLKKMNLNMGNHYCFNYFEKAYRNLSYLIKNNYLFLIFIFIIIINILFFK